MSELQVSSIDSRTREEPPSARTRAQTRASAATQNLVQQNQVLQDQVQQAQLLNQDLEMSSESSSTSSSSSSSFALSAYVRRPVVNPALSDSSSEAPSRTEQVAAAPQQSVHASGSGISRLLVKQAAKIPKIFTSRLSCQLAIRVSQKNKILETDLKTIFMGCNIMLKVRKS